MEGNAVVIGLDRRATGPTDRVVTVTTLRPNEVARCDAQMNDAATAETRRAVVTAPYRTFDIVHAANVKTPDLIGQMHDNDTTNT